MSETKPTFIADDVASIALLLKELENKKDQRRRKSHLRLHINHDKFLYSFVHKNNFKNKILKPILEGIRFESCTLKFFDMSMHADDDLAPFNMEHYKSKNTMFVFDFVQCPASAKHKEALERIARKKYEEDINSQMLCFFCIDNYNDCRRTMLDRMYNIEHHVLERLVKEVYE